MKIKKLVKRVLVSIVLIIFLIISSGVIFSIIYKDKIIGYFINQTNKHITTPIDVGKIEVSIFNHFPNLSVNLYQVTIKENVSNHQGILGQAKKISVSFNPIDLLRKNYSIHGVHITDGEVYLKIDKEGIPNYLFYKRDSASKGQKLTLQNLTAENLKIDYFDMKSTYHVAMLVKKATSYLEQIDTLLNVHVKGELVTDEITVNKRKFFDNKLVEIETEIVVDLRNKVYNFNTGNLKIDKGEFEVTGEIDQIAKFIDLKITGINTSFQTINSLLSNDISKHFQHYRSRGKVYFSGNVVGNYGDNTNPMVTLDFGAKDASFYHPQYKKEIENVNLTGHFTTSKVNRPENYRLDLTDFSCQLEDKLLDGSLSLKNFSNYWIDLVLKGEADVNTLLLLFPKEFVKTAFGTLKMDIHINGQLEDPKLTKTMDANGEIELKNLSFVLYGEKLPFNKINGSLILRNNDLAVSDLRGNVGNSDFRLNGFIKNISNILFIKNKFYKMQADLQSTHIDFDELLKSNFASRDTSSNKNNTYEFRISPKISLDFNCEIDHLKFQRFHGKDIKGQVEINNQIAVLKNVSFASMGGRVNISGSVNSKKDNMVETISEATLSNINIDSIFYVFKNFNQDWLVDKNLKGQLEAEINLYMNFSKNLALNSKSLVADIHTSINNGELNDFEPMMRLSKFVEEKSLAQMRFSKMTNEIKIENRTIYLPEMEIRSNVSNILISGTHTFDKEIDYHLSVPLKSFIRISKKKDYDESARRGIHLLLKITGNTSDYAISYDTKALKDNITKDFRDEGQEWKNLRKKEPLTEDEIPELEEEYFDFEDPEKDSIN